MEFKEALEKVLDCDECGQEVCSNIVECIAVAKFSEGKSFHEFVDAG